VSLRERFEKLEPREQKLLLTLGGILGAFLFLLVPIGIISTVSGKRADNEEIRHLVSSIYDSRQAVADRRAKKDAILERYGKPAPQLAGFIEEATRTNGITAAESQDLPEQPHGKRYTERQTVVKMHKVGMLALAKTLEKIETSGHPVTIAKLTIKPRIGEPDSYEVELGVSAYDRKADTPPPGSAPSAAPSASAAEEEEP